MLKCTMWRKPSTNQHKRNIYMKQFFSFSEFVTPKLMKVFFGVMLSFLVAICIASLAVSARAGSWDGVLSSIMVLVIGSILIRMVCDVVLVLFRIYGVLRDMRESMQLTSTR